MQMMRCNVLQYCSFIALEYFMFHCLYLKESLPSIMVGRCPGQVLNLTKPNDLT